MDDTPSWAQQQADVPSWAGSSAPPAPKPQSSWSNLPSAVGGMFWSTVDNGTMMQPARYVAEHLDVGGIMPKLKAKYPGQSDDFYKQKLHDAYGGAVTDLRKQDQAAVDTHPYPGHLIGNTVTGAVASIPANPELMFVPGASLEAGALKGGLRAAAPKVAQYAASNAARFGVANAASDAAAQMMDKAEGQQTGWDVDRSLQAAGMGAVLGAGHAAIHSVGASPVVQNAPIPDFVKNLFVARGVDTTPQPNPNGITSPLTGSQIRLSPEEQAQFKQVLKTGSVDDIKNFLRGKNGHQPSWSQVNQMVQMRDNFPDNMVNGDNARQAFDEHIDDQHQQLVSNHIETQTQGWKNKPQVEVVNHVNDIEDPVVRQKAIDDGVTHENTVGFLGDDGKVRVFAPQVRSPEAVNAVLYHEALGHFGLQQQFGAGLDKVLDTLANRNVGGFGKEVDKWQKNNPEAYGGDRTRAAEEVLAERSQNGPLPKSWADAVVSHVRRFGRQMGLKLSYSDAEVNHILSMAHDAVINGKRGNVIANNFGHQQQEPKDKWLNFDDSEPAAPEWAKEEQSVEQPSPAEQQADKPYVKSREEIDTDNEQVRKLLEAFKKPVGDSGNRYMRSPELDKKFSDLPPEDKETWRNIGVKDYNTDIKLHNEAMDAFENYVDKYPEYIGQDRRDILQHIRQWEPELNDEVGRPAFVRAVANGHEDLRNFLADRGNRIRNLAAQRDALTGAKSDRGILENLPDWVHEYMGKKLGDSGNRFMTPDQFNTNGDKPLPFTQDDVIINRRLRGRLLHDGPANPLSPEARSEIEDRLVNEHGDIQHLIDDVNKAWKEGRVPNLAKSIHVFDNRTGEVAGVYKNRTDALNAIKAQGPDAQHFGIERLGTNNRYMTPQQLNRSIAYGTYEVEQMEHAYNATDMDYQPTHRSFDDVREEALRAGFSPSQIKAMGNGPDISKRLFRIQAAAKVLDSRISGLLQKVDTPEWSVGHADALRQAIVDHAYILAKLRDERAETARALNMSKAGYTRSQMESYGEILRDGGGPTGPLGDDDTLLRFARTLKTVAGGHNPDGLNEAISALSKPNWEDYLTTLHQNMMLSGLSTHIKAPLDMMIGIGRDLLDNASALPLSAAREALQAIGIKVKPGVHPTEVAARLWGVLRAGLDAETYKNTASTFVNGGYNPNGFGGKMNARIPVISKVTDLISAQDAFFRAFSTNMHLYGLGTRQALEEARANGTPKDWDTIMTQGASYARQPSPELLKQAKALADENLLLNKNAFTAPLDKLKRTTPDSSFLQRAGAFVANFLTPFVRVESNSLMTRVIRRSPLAFFDPQTIKDLKAGGIRGDVAMTRIVMGTAAIASYWAAAGKGKTTGDGPDNPAKKAVLEATGWRPNSVHENGQYNTGNKLGISLNPFDVHNATASMVADLREAYEKGANQGQVATGLKLAVLSSIKSLTDMSWVSDLAPAIGAFTAPNSSMESKVSQFLGDQASTMVPNLVGQATRVADQDQRMTQVPGSIGQTVMNSVKSNIPGQRESLPTRNDPFGDPLQSGASMFGQHTWLPQENNRSVAGNHVDETHDPAKLEIGRLSQMYTDNIVSPVQRTITVNGEKMKLNNEQFSEYQRMAGHEILATLRDEMNSPEWSQMSDESKAEWIRDMQKDRKKAVRDYLYGEH